MLQLSRAHRPHIVDPSSAWSAYMDIPMATYWRWHKTCRSRATSASQTKLAGRLAPTRKKGNRADGQPTGGHSGERADSSPEKCPRSSARPRSCGTIVALWRFR